jgi:hypothetical protein
MVNPFATKPSSEPGTDDLLRRCPFPEQPPFIGSRAKFLDDEIVWSSFLKQLGGSEEEDAATITAFANRLGIDRGMVLAKIETHFFDDSQALH